MACHAARVMCHTARVMSNAHTQGLERGEHLSREDPSKVNHVHTASRSNKACPEVSQVKHVERGYSKGCEERM